MFENDQVGEATDNLTKTYHIGEVCLHGTVRLDVMMNADIRVRFYNYKTTDLQEEETFSFVDKFKLLMHLEDRMSSYYADNIINDFYA